MEVKMSLCSEIENLRRTLMDARDSSLSDMMRQVESVEQKLGSVLSMHRQYANVDYGKVQKIQKYQKYLESSLKKAKRNIRNRDKKKIQKRMDKTIKAIQKAKELFNCSTSSSQFVSVPSVTSVSVPPKPATVPGCGCGGPKPQPPKPQVVQPQAPKPQVVHTPKVVTPVVQQPQLQTPVTPVQQPQVTPQAVQTPKATTPVQAAQQPTIVPPQKVIPQNVLNAAKALAAKPGGCGCGKKSVPPAKTVPMANSFQPPKPVAPVTPVTPVNVTPVPQTKMIVGEPVVLSSALDMMKGEENKVEISTPGKAEEKKVEEVKVEETPKVEEVEKKKAEEAKTEYKLFVVDHEAITADFSEKTMPKLLLDQASLDQIIQSIDLNIVLDLPFLGGEHLQIHLTLDPSSNSPSSFFKIFKGEVQGKTSNMQLNLSKVKNGIVSGFLVLDNKRYNLTKQDKHYLFV